MSNFDYDLLVIGAGSGGVRAARMAGGFGARVAIVEDRYMGGTCVNVGCVPKKLYVYAAQYGKGFGDAQGFGWDSNKPRFDWSTLRDNKKDEISRLNVIYRNLLKGANAQVIDGRAVIVEPPYGVCWRAAVHGGKNTHRDWRLAAYPGLSRQRIRRQLK